MQTQDAIKLLIEAVSLAQSRGAYNLKEAGTILQAVETFTNNQDNNMNDETNQTTVKETPVVEASVEQTPVEEVAQPQVAGEADLAPSTEVPE